MLGKGSSGHHQSASAAGKAGRPTELRTESHSVRYCPINFSQAGSSAARCAAIVIARVQQRTAGQGNDRHRPEGKQRRTFFRADGIPNVGSLQLLRRLYYSIQICGR